MYKKLFVVSDTHNVFKDAKGPPDDPTAFGEARLVNGTLVPIIDPVKEAQKKQNEIEYLAYLATFYKDYIDAWNGIVRPNDLVVHLGDVIWDIRKLPVFSLLNGVKHLVLGNHDSAMHQKLYKMYFTNVQTFNSYEGVIFSHEPICPDHRVFNRSAAGQYAATLDLSPYTINVHGHFHYQGLTKEFFRGEDRRRAMAVDRIFRFYDTDTHLIHYCVDHLPLDLNTIRAEVNCHKDRLLAA